MTTLLLTPKASKVVLLGGRMEGILGQGFGSMCSGHERQANMCIFSRSVVKVWVVKY